MDRHDLYQAIIITVVTLTYFGLRVIGVISVHCNMPGGKDEVFCFIYFCLEANKMLVVVL